MIYIKASSALALKICAITVTIKNYESTHKVLTINLFH